MSSRIGTGTDVHAFAPGVPLWLGGVLVPWDKGLAGHSDGDAVLHALIDALLGAAGRGDIGEWFPSTEERWRGARSSSLLSHVWGELRTSWSIENIDITVVAAEPKLYPFKAEMRSGIARILDVPVDRVSVKATTTDGLGFTGRKEGLLANAVVLLTERAVSSDRPSL